MLLSSYIMYAFNFVFHVFLEDFFFSFEGFISVNYLDVVLFIHRKKDIYFSKT